MTRQELLQIAKPILFNTEMVMAILDGRKTVTRRVVKTHCIDAVLNSPARIENPDISDDRFINCLCDAPYQKGDILYVRETWQIDSICDKEKEMLIYFKATKSNYSIMQTICRFNSQRYKDVRKFYQKKGWQPSLSMPKEATRIFLRVTGVRVEKLWDITEEQAIKEGMYPHGDIDDEKIRSSCVKCDFIATWGGTIKECDYGKYDWYSNPWVWVIKFERVEV